MRKWIYEDITPGLDKGINWDELYKSQKKKSKQKGISMLQGGWANGKNCSNFLPNPAGSISMFNHMMGNDTNSSNCIAGDSSMSDGSASAIGGMGESFIKEKIEKQEDIVYKGITIEHFPLSWQLGDKSWDEDGWIIMSPYYIQSNNDKPRTYMPLYAEDENGEVINFKTSNEAKDYIDTYIEPKKGYIKIKHGDECHFVLDNSNELVKRNKDLAEYYDYSDDSYRWKDLDDLDESGIGIFTAYFTAALNDQDIDIDCTSLDVTDDYGYLYADDDNVVFNDNYRDIRVNIADIDIFIDDILYACNTIFEPGKYEVSGKFEYYLDGYINTSNSEYNQIDASFSMKDATVKRVD